MTTSEPIADELITIIHKNSREEFRISIREYKGHRLIDLRVYVASSDGVSVPTAKSASIRLDLVGDVLDGLRLAERRVTEMGLQVRHAGLERAKR